MKQLFVFLVATILLLIGCGNKTAEKSADTAVADSLMNETAVVGQVEKVYKYLNDIRQYYLDTPEDQIEDKVWERPDVYFSTQEWQQLRLVADSIDRECEGGGAFDFGDNGPFDPWLYDCFEGAATVENIKVVLNDDGTAQADFGIRDATTIGNIPLRWLLRVENGEWRVADIIFLKNDTIGLLQHLKSYCGEE